MTLSNLQMTEVATRLFFKLMFEIDSELLQDGETVQQEANWIVRKDPRLELKEDSKRRSIFPIHTLANQSSTLRMAIQVESIV